MKFRIMSYQTILSDGSRDKIKLPKPIYTNDLAAERQKLKIAHNGLGIKCVGINLEIEQLK